MAEEGVEVDVVCMAPGQVVSGMHEGPPGLMVCSYHLFLHLLS